MKMYYTFWHFKRGFKLEIENSYTMYIPGYLRLNFTVDISELSGPSTANKQLSPLP